MTDKEEKAVERCNQLIKIEHANWIGISNQKAIGTILDLIQTQQEEIEKYKYLYQKSLDNTIKADRDNLKKNKVIDLMAIAIVNYDDQLVINRYKDKEHVKETFEEYFINKVEKEIK